MAASTHTVAVNVEKKALWSFIESKEQWATLIPGYLHHELKSADEMIWVFEGDFGMIKKPVKVSLKVKSVNPENKLMFDLEGLSDNINGSGYFEIADTGELIGHLDLKAGGFLAAMINPVLENYVPKTTKDLVDEMGKFVTNATV